MSGSPAPGSPRTRRRSSAVVLTIGAAFAAGALLQALYEGHAGELYTQLLAWVAAPILAGAQPAPVVSGLAVRGSLIQVRSDLAPAAALGAIDARVLTSLMPFCLALAVLAGLRHRAISPRGVLALLAFLFSAQVACVALGGLRLADLALVRRGGPALIGPAEYNLLHTLYHVYAHFGPELWSGLLAGWVLFAALGQEALPAEGEASAARARGGAAMVGATLLLPAAGYLVLSPAAHRLSGRSDTAALEVARACLDDGRPEAAAAIARRVVASGGRTMAARMLLAESAEAADAAEAERGYDAVIAAHPEYVPARLRKARLEARRGSPTAAEHYYAVLALDPRNAEAYEELGDWYMRQGAFDLAERHYAMALRFHPERPGPVVKLARARQLAAIVEARRER